MKRKIFGYLSIFSLLFNLLSPLANLQLLYAQEVTPVSETETTVTPAPEQPADAPAAEQPAPAETPVPAPSETPVPAPSETPVPSPSASAAPAAEPTPAPAPEATPSVELSPLPQESSSAESLWSEIGDNNFKTSGNVEVNRDYSAPFNDKVKVNFSKLPADSGILTIKEVKLTPEQIARTKALSDTAYEITSTMVDGTFTYDLTLPLPPQAQNRDVEVKAAENETELSGASELSEQKEKAADTITIKELNHFTVFVITTPDPDTAQRVLINEVVPTAGAEWVELFNNGTQPVDLTGWTIRNAAGNSQSLSALGTVAAASRVVFDAPLGWLSDTAPETITLSNNLGTSVDTVTISLTAPGIAVDHYPLASESVGRETDGVANWVVFATPTKGTANIVPVAVGNGITALSPVNPTTGFPVWFKDSNGLALDLMEAADPFGISDPVNPANPFSQQIGFNAEGFWWSADASFDNGVQTGLLVLAVEAAFVGDSAVDGEQSAFGRIRVRLDGLTPGETYTIRHPYGTLTEVADVAGVINVTDDTGCFATGIISCDPNNPAGNPNNFSLVLGSAVGPFLTWTTYPNDPFLINPVNPTRKYIGNPSVAHAVTGSPINQNFFRVEGLGLPGGAIQVDNFTVTGRLADASAPVITLHGSNPVSVNQNAVYTDAGASAIDDQGGNVTGNIQVTGLPVDTATLGEKTVTYTVTDSVGHTATATRTVNVVVAPVDATAPVITVTGDNPASVVAGTTYVDAGATAADDIDGNISANISTAGLPINTTVPGTFTVTYSVSDAAGNPATATRTVNVVADTVLPVITLTGQAVVNVLAGGAYTDAGATATDNVNGDITANIVATGLPIDTTIIRSNTVTYNVSDTSGNAATPVTRTVNVVNAFPAGLAAVGPVDQTHGYPAWYKDGAGISLQPCLGLADGLADGNCILGADAGFNPAQAISFPANFPGESFYWFAESELTLGNFAERARLRMVLEAAFGTGSPAANQQMTFLRVNFTMPQTAGAFTANSTYTVNYPFGSIQFTTDAAGAPILPGGHVRTEDGVIVGNFTALLPATTTSISRFLKWDPAVGPAAPAGYLGNPDVPHAITGSPLGAAFNRVSVTGPNAGGAGVNTVEQTLFTVAGKLADVTPPVITITGVNPVDVALNAAYTDAGATAADDFDGIVTVTTTGLPVDTSTLGAKTVTYTATDRTGNTATATRTVNVVGTSVLTSVSVTPASATVAVGGAAQLTASPLDQTNAPFVGATITYSSADPNTVSVSAGGLLTGILAGGPVNVTVTATSGAASVTQIVPVTVSLGPVLPVLTSVTVAPATATLNIGATQQLTASPLDQNLTAFVGATVAWSTSNSAIATVSNTGLVTAVAAGQAVITATATSGAISVTTTAAITVNPAPAVAAITVTPANPTITGTTQTFTAPAVDGQGNPIAATPTFAVSNPGVGTINPTTGVFTATGAGSTIVTAAAGTVTNSTVVTVQAVPTVVAVSPAAPTLGVGENITFAGLVTDQFGALTTNAVTFASSNPAVGTINASTGVFTPVSAGTTTITASTGEGVVDSTVVTVTAAAQTGNLSDINITAPTDITKVGGSTIQLVVSPVDNNGGSVAGTTTTYVSSNPSVATVDTSGLVTPVNPGKTTIRVSSTNGTTTVRRDFNITVEREVSSVNLGSLITDQVFQPAAGSTVDSTLSVTVAQPVAINIDDIGGKTHKVRIPTGTVITRVDGAAINANSLSATVPAAGDISGFLTGATINGALQWGIPNIGLSFSGPVTIDINVGAAFNGQTLSVLRSTSGNSAWTADGIVAPASCVVANGLCSFQITKASYFASYQAAATPTSDSSSSSSSSNSGSGSSSAPVCNDAKPGSAPTLSGSVTGPNEVTLTWTKASDPVTFYLVAFGLSAGDIRFGNPNVGGKDTTSTVIKGLSGGTTYFFKVRAGNGCNAGDYSNEVALTATGEALPTNIPAGFEEGVLGAQVGGALGDENTGTGTGGAVTEDSPSASPDTLAAQIDGNNPSSSASNTSKGLPGWLILASLALLSLGGLGFYSYRKAKRN